MIYATNQRRNLSRLGLRAPSALSLLGMRGLRGLGSTPDLVGQITLYFNSFMGGLASNMEHGMAATPDMVRETLTQAAKDSCAAASPSPCDPTSVLSLIDSMVAQYSAAYNTQAAKTAGQVSTGQIAAPSGYIAPTGGGQATAYATPSIAPAPTYPSPIVPTQVATGGGEASTVAMTPTQATLRNMSRPNMPLQVGDLFALDVQGAPNSPVKITATKNGGSPSSQVFGNTDGSGSRSITGGMSVNEVGSWVELIQVGSGRAYTLQFNVSPVNTTAAGSQPSASGPTGGGGSTATTDAGTMGVAVAASSSGVPWWVWLAGAGAAFYMFGGRR